MASPSAWPKFIVIVGPTASGKSELAMRVAKQFNGEIIAADSRTVYKGMDIGTVKPTMSDRTQVPHWGLDLVEPGQRFTVAEFKLLAEKWLKDIQRRGRLPIVVGGTGLYIDGLLFDFGFIAKLNPAKRAELERLSVNELQAIIKKKGYRMPENLKNKRYLVRTIERAGVAGGRRRRPPAGSLTIGLKPSNDELKRRINRRSEAMFKAGIINETKTLAAKYGQPALLKTSGIVYKIIAGLLSGNYDQNRAIELSKNAEWQYARRQRTYFKRNPYIKWFDNPQAAYEFIRGQLASGNH